MAIDSKAMEHFNPREHLMQIKSKAGSSEYLPVQWRLVWFRELCPQGTIETELVLLDLDRETEEEAFVWNNEKKRSEKIIKTARGIAVFRAVVKDGKGGVATGTKSEKAASFPDFIEKAETGAIGRALAALGYGTQFTADELTEGHRIVDSPVETKPSDIDALRSEWARAYSIIDEQVEARWPKFKVYALGSNVADPDLTASHIGKMTKIIKEKLSAA